MLISTLNKLNELNETLFTPVDNVIKLLPINEIIIDAFIDTIHLLPFLFFIFLFIEIIEFYFSSKFSHFFKKLQQQNVIIGAIASIFPQCGFSVLASSLYSQRKITKGCLIAIYLGTSDETIPILLSYPNKAYLIIPIVGIKLFIAILCGYMIDILTRQYEENKILKDTQSNAENANAEGCCAHKINSSDKKQLILHPLIHTLNIVGFIFLITLILNYLLDNIVIMDIIKNSTHKYLQCITGAVIGLIPNCAISIGFTVLLIKGSIPFSVAMSGLLANSGLGLLVLLKNNRLKDNLNIIIILLLISIISGCLIEFII
ncbi:arsenic efflux protein [bacterium]|nr:arsenic efflux protein [bacterium]